MLDDRQNLSFLVCGEQCFRGRESTHELVENGDSVFAVRADEEGDGDEELEGVVGELFLDEAEGGGGEGREGNA
jgi:hypothetical protein